MFLRLFCAALGVWTAACSGGDSQPGQAPEQPTSAFTATIDRVVDGDTLIAHRGAGPKLRVRLIGIDAPEVNDGSRPPECLAGAASAYLRRAVEGRVVRAAYQPGGRRDRFGRELWDVWLVDGSFVAALLVEQGLARTMALRPQVAYAPVLSRLEGRARSDGRGIWDRGRCPQ